MKLCQLTITRMPGFAHRGFTLDQLGQKLTCIWGPNGSGKTSACLAIRRLLWPNDPSVKDSKAILSSLWEHADQRGEISVIGREHQAAKFLPLAEIQKFSPHLYTIAIDDLFPSTDSEFAASVAKEMRGGYDLGLLRQEYALSKNLGDKEMKEVRAQGELLDQEIRRQEQIYSQELTLVSLEEQIGMASAAEKRLHLLQAALSYQERQAEVEQIRKKLASFPKGLDKMRPEDREQLENLIERKKSLRLARLPEQGKPEMDLELVKGLIQDLRELEREITANERALLEAREQRLAYGHELGWDLEKLEEIQLADLADFSVKLKRLHEEELGLMALKAKAGSQEDKRFWTLVSLGVCLSGFAIAALALPYTSLLFSTVIAAIPLLALGLLWKKKNQDRKTLETAEKKWRSTCQEVDAQCISMGFDIVPEYSLIGTFLQQVKTAQQLRVIEKKNEASHEVLLKKRAGLVEEINRQFGESYALVAEMESALARKNKERDWSDLHTRLSELLVRCGCASEGEFFERFSLLAAYGQAAAEESKLQGSLAELMRQLQAVPELMNVSREALTEEKAQLQMQAANLRNLIETKAGIEKEIERTRSGHELEIRRKAFQEAKERLEEKREEFIERGLALFLLDEVEESYRKETRPEALRSADHYFQQFTKSAYAIHGIEESQGEAAFVAWDCAESQVKQLHELSRGTRLQLLLAVRLGFIRTIEKGGVKLPLILDEAAAHADDERWRAIADVLNQEAQTGRQILYFTCQSFARDAWKEISDDVVFINLSDAHQQLPYNTLSLPVVEAPFQNETHIDYCKRIEMPGLDFALPASAQHVGHFLNSPQELHAFLSAGIKTLGQLQKMHERQCLHPFLNNEKARAILAKGMLLDQFLAHYRVGRAPSVERSDLEEALDQGCVTDKFFQPLWELIQEEKGCGDRIVAALENKKIKGYRADKIEALRDFFRERSKLDTRSPYSTEELQTSFWTTYATQGEALPREDASHFLSLLLQHTDTN